MMHILFSRMTISFFVLGAIIASFVGVLVARLNTGTSFLTGRSQCDACGASLLSSSLIPVVSYVASGGRARCCGARLSPLSPLTELLLGALFALLYLQLGLSLSLLGMLVSLSLLLALVLYDLVHQILPTPLLGALILSSALTRFSLALSWNDFLSSVFTALLIAASLLCIHFLSRGRAMGFADAPFAFALALLVGPVALSGFVFSFWIGAVIGVFILFRRPAGSRMGVEVPFAPFLAAGFLLALLTQWNLFTLIASLTAFQ